MEKKTLDNRLNDMKDNLESCPICGSKADIIAMHIKFMNQIVIDEVGCENCHLSVKRKWYSSPKKIDVLQVWNKRTSFTKINNTTYSAEEEVIILTDIERCVIRYANGYQRDVYDAVNVHNEEWFRNCEEYIKSRKREIKTECH